MGESQSKRVSGCRLLKKKIVDIDFVIDKSNYLYIHGRVYNPLGQPMPFSAVVVIRIDETTIPPEHKYLGVTFANEQGYYGFSIYSEQSCSYKLKAYCYMG